MAYKVAELSSPCQTCRLTPASVPFSYFAAAPQVFHLLEHSQTLPTSGICTVISSTKNLSPLLVLFL